MVIHPEQEACREIKQLMKYPYAVQARSFEGGRLTMVGIRIDRWNKSMLDGKTLSEICKENDRFRFTVVAVFGIMRLLYLHLISNFLRMISLILFLNQRM